MPNPFPKARKGKAISYPSGFPVFYDRTRKTRIITAAPWSLLRQFALDKLDKSRERIAISFLEQAHEFHEAASNPKFASRPLLYYYSMLNLVKFFLLLKRVKIAQDAHHGISDPKVNGRERTRLEGQVVKIKKSSDNKSEIFPEFISALGGSTEDVRTIKIVDLLAQIPSIHRTFCDVSRTASKFAPINNINIMRDGRNYWVRLSISKSDKDIKDCLPHIKLRRVFTQNLYQVDNSSNDPSQDLAWFETDSEQGHQRGVDLAIQRLAKRIRCAGIWPVLTRTGYRHYLGNFEPRKSLAPLAAPFAAVFYLGSITRYKPYVFDTILAGGYSWIVDELISVIPDQFIYMIASHLLATEVVRPYAVL